MTTQPEPKPTKGNKKAERIEPLGAAFQPTRREILKPVELVGGAGFAAIFVGLIVLLSTRQWLLTAVFVGITFIVVLMVLALFAMGSKKDAEETADIERQDNPDARH